ncbi:MAG: cell surface protein [Planctomycetota bacterium]
MRLSLCVLLSLLPRTALLAAGQPYLSPVALATDAEARFVCVAMATGHRLTIIETIEGRVVREIPLPEAPSGVVADGMTLYVTGDAPAGRVSVIDVRTGDIERSFPAGHMPRSPVLAPDGTTLLVLNRFEELVTFLNRATGTRIARVALPREPIDATLTSDGATLLVAHHLPVGPATAQSVAAEVSFVDTRSRTVTDTVSLPNGATSVREICLSPDGRYAFCTHILARYHNPTSQLVRGWINTNAVSIIDVSNRSLCATVLLDDVDLGAANPWAVACSNDGTTLAVTHAGTHEVSLIDLPALMKKLAGLDDDARTEVRNDLAFLLGVRRRVPLPGLGPRAALFVGSDLYVAEYFSDSLGVIDTTAIAGEEVQAGTIALGSSAPTDPVRLGELHFHDARLCFQKWQSCSSCHPDGRADALNWDLLNDGLGNPKNTKSLLLAHETPPAMIMGGRASAEVAVRAGVRHIQAAIRPEEDLEALDLYLRSLRPVPSPYLVGNALSPAAERGREVFVKAQCDACHRSPYYTDLRQYDLGMGRGQDEARPMDTPTLVEIWRTAPYLHDGRARDLRSLITEHNEGDRHGHTGNLSEAELQDLLAYLLSL